MSQHETQTRIRLAGDPAPRHLQAVKLLMVLALGLSAGCQTGRVADPITSRITGDTAESQMEFWHTLATRPQTSNDEAFHAMLLFMDGQDTCADYPARLARLRSLDVLPKGFDGEQDEAVQRGTLAVIAVRHLGIKGGMMLRLMPRSPRYAVRELRYMNLYTLSSPQQTFSGSEMVGLIGRLEDYQRQHPVMVPAHSLPGEAPAEPEQDEEATGTQKRSNSGDLAGRTTRRGHEAASLTKRSTRRDHGQTGETL